MVLEALAAVGLAGNLLQFIDFSCKLLAEARETRDSITGSTHRNLELETVASRLRHLTASLSCPSSTPGGAIERQMQSLADEAAAVAQELLNAIDDVRARGPATTFKSVAQALRNSGKNKIIEKLGAKLERMQGQLNAHLHVMLSNKHSLVIDELEKLGDKTVQNHSLVVDQLEGMEDEARLLGVSTAGNINKTRHEILKAVARLEISSQVQAKDTAKRLSEDIAQVSQKLFQLAADISTTKATQDVLRSLLFKTMKIREAKIVSAHTDTFEWIFAEKANNKKPAGFRYWLKREAGIFWVMGKAGSGKSTLMKFLINHCQTGCALSEWAGTKKLIVASFFFWHAGTDMQNSQEGLFRSLLFEILRQYPALIPKIVEKSQSVPGYDSIEESWTIPKLLECFTRLRKQTTDTAKFCFFIDGLDEYDGESSDLVQALQDLLKSPNIKICASSRPWFIFKDAFGQSPDHMLKLEHLTRQDIATFINDTLGTHPRFVKLREKDNRYFDLIQQIMEKARGVFLWVFLVTKSLQRGLTNADKISDLQRRISLLPDSLEEYFRLMFRSIEDVYREQTARLFQYALNPPPSEPIPLLVFSYLHEDDPDFALKVKGPHTKLEEVHTRYEDTKRLLDGRTRGLLEVTEPTTFTDLPTVDFLHRTVRDFFLTKEMQHMLKSNLDPTFVVDVDMCKAFLAHTKLGPRNPAGGFLSSVLHYVHDVEERTESAASEIVDEIEKLIVSQSRTRWNMHYFHCLLVNYNLFHSLSERLKEVPRTLDTSDRPLLDIALRCVKRQHEVLNPKIINLLLLKGADPNEPFGIGSSVWADFVLSIHVERRLQRKIPSEVSQVLELMLSHGADPDRVIKDWDGREMTASSIIREHFPRDAEWILKKAYPRCDNVDGRYVGMPRGYWN